MKCGDKVVHKDYEGSGYITDIIDHSPEVNYLRSYFKTEMMWWKRKKKKQTGMRVQPVSFQSVCMT